MQAFRSSKYLLKSFRPSAVSNCRFLHSRHVTHEQMKGFLDTHIKFHTHTHTHTHTQINVYSLLTFLKRYRAELKKQLFITRHYVNLTERGFQANGGRFDRKYSRSTAKFGSS
jgi:hypothetical protein